MDIMVVAIASIFAFALGACIGSFLNVVVYRIPANLSLIHPPSRCPHCLHRLGATENIPVFGWLWLRGRCRWCRTPISMRYPLVEAATGLLFVLVYWKFGLNLTAVSYWTLLSWLLALSLIDLDTMTLPNALTQSGLVVGLGFHTLQGWQEGHIANYLMLGIGSAVLGIWLFDAIRLIGSIAYGQTAMGGGDPKLAATIGAWLGWKYLLVTGFLACAAGALIGGVAIAFGRLNRRQPMPFGPFLALGAVLTVFFGNEIVSSYLKIFFPLGSW
ncbi:MAG: prepilin peptidase [Hydrococcus sp. C42_A2020_068]|uniref:prepilin peptidase n=1 Tax=Pleurocapsa sp. PCC 7327 TaxID=118163 RepID=UPI0002A00039|nr:prepilin signal peptidase PulO-like peptidase [Pleurocapsa sp. PCC 7327]MBF2022765.1 prepilin peptidase [Hydrococcus sp. C42_A2020_068]